MKSLSRTASIGGAALTLTASASVASAASFTASYSSVPPSTVFIPKSLMTSGSTGALPEPVQIMHQHAESTSSGKASGSYSVNLKSIASRGSVYAASRGVMSASGDVNGDAIVDFSDVDFTGSGAVAFAEYSDVLIQPPEGWSGESVSTQLNLELRMGLGTFGPNGYGGNSNIAVNLFVDVGPLSFSGSYRVGQDQFPPQTTGILTTVQVGSSGTSPITIPLVVPVGQLIAVRLRIEAGGDGLSGGAQSFAPEPIAYQMEASLSLPVAAERGDAVVFDLPEGFTVNSAEALIVNNQFVGSAAGLPCPGDTNGDNLIDFQDLNAVISSFNSVEGDLNYNPGADIDADGDVDFADLNVVVSSFNLSC